MAQAEATLGRNVPVACGVSVFCVALVVPSSISWALSDAPFQLGLPQIAAALVLGGLVFGLALARERKLASRMDALRAGLDIPQTASGLDAMERLAIAVQTAGQELKHQKGLAQGILGGLPLPFLLVDEKERAVCSNQDCLTMLELDGRPEDYYGQTLAQIFYNDPGRKTAVGRSIGGGEVFRNLEVQIKGHRGGVRHVLANVFPLYDTDKRCIGGLCLYIDMTALKQKEQVIVEKNEGISSAAENADGLCRRLHESSDRLSGGIEQTRRGSEVQKARMGEISVAMDQMSEAVVDVAKSAAAAAHGADEARQQAEQGARVVQEVIAAIHGVSQRTQNMQQHLSELGVQVAGIGQILSVISDIADQTNLLALNAAIEAARAGDAGRGFAVVADEVRKLAEKTMQATGEVARAIGSVQEGARKSALGMSEAVSAVESSTGLADKAGHVLKEILRISEGSADQVRTIAAASEEQSASAEQISRAMDEVSAVSETTAGEMAAAASAVNQLAQLAEELKDLIQRMQSC